MVTMSPASEDDREGGLVLGQGLERQALLR